MTGPIGFETARAEGDNGATGARQLGRVVSLAARIEPELIRAARLRLMPHLDVSAEADLWFSPLVQSRTPLAIVLRADVVEALRAELAEDLRLLDGAWDVLRTTHETAPPVLRLEEQLTWLGLRGERSDADVNDLLRQAVYSMVDEDRSGIARWTARAFERLPQAVKQHEAARMLNVGAKARLGSPIDPADADAPGWSWVVPSNLPSISVRVRLLDGAVEIGAESSEWAHALDVPKTNPPFVEVSWERDQVTRARQVAVPEPVTSVVVVTGTSNARIRTGLGRAFELSRREGQPTTHERFLDFRLRFEAESGRRAYRIEASGPAGEESASFKVPFSDAELENFILKVGRTRRGSRIVTRRIESPELELARTFGERLFDAVMPGQIARLYRAARSEAQVASQGLRLALLLGRTPELEPIPWEFLYDQPNFLSVSTSTPVVRYFDLPRPTPALRIDSPLRILALVTSPVDVEQIDKELERTKLETVLRPLINAGSVTLDFLPEANLRALVRTVQSGEYHIFHFIGHSGFSTDDQSGALLLEDELGRAQVVTAAELASMIRDSRSLRLVVLNASEGARNSVNDPFAGVATVLIQQGLPAVIGMQFEMTDAAMAIFSGEFYGGLANGEPVDVATAEARLAIFAGGNDIEWGSPVLYTSVSDGRIFDLERAPRPSEPFDQPFKSAS